MKTTLLTATLALSSTLFLVACGSPAQQSSAPVYAPTQSPYASNTGFIDSIQVVRTSNPGNPGVGAVVGGVVGGILGNQVGGGTGKTAATVVGVVGGAVVGNQIEQNNRAAGPDLFQISVRLDNGNYQSVQQESMFDMQVGTRVRIDNGRVYRY